MTLQRAVIATGLLCATVVPAGVAYAHNGVGAAFKGRAGHYIVYAYDGELLSDGRLDYKLVLLNAATKNPVYDAEPTVNAQMPGDNNDTYAKVTSFGNVFFYNLPNPYPHDWDVHLEISGPLGRGATNYRIHGLTPAAEEQAEPRVVPEPQSNDWPWILGATAGAAVVSGVAYGRLRIRRRSN